MIIEQLIFILIAFLIFVYTFFKMIKRNDTTYVIVLVLEATGIALNFVEVLFKIKLNMLFIILKYILSIILPISIMLLEKRGFYFYEIWNIGKAKMYCMMENHKKAKQALLTILDKNPNSHKAHRMLGEIYEIEGGLRKAIDEYVQAVDANKKDYDSYYRVADLLNVLDKKEEAAQMLFNLLNIKPDIYEASVLLGDILLQSEHYKEAANVYQEALRFNPASYDLNYNLGIAYTMLNDFQSAKVCYEKAAELNSLAYNSKYSLAEIAMIYKDLEEAERKLLEAIEDEELSADGYYELSKIYLIKGDKETAIKYVNIAIDINSKKIVEKIKKDPIFIPIIARVSIPFNLENQEKEIEEKLEQKEIRAKEHLEEMVEITRHLGYSDIRLLKKNALKQGNEIQKNEKEQIEQNQKERQE